MERGKGYVHHDYTKSPIYFFPREEILLTYPFKEEFVDLNYYLHPEIYQMYMISNHGRIFHKYLNQILNINIDSKGYSYKPLATSNGQRNYRVHRLLMESFCYYEGCNEMLVNHKDGNKLNNLITNLEWCTYSENARHAYDTGLVSRIHKSKYDKDIIKAICKELMNPSIKFTEIAEKYGVNLTLVDSIYFGKAHCEIAKEYNFPPRIKRKFLSNCQVEKICEYYQANSPRLDMSKQYYRDALSYAGIYDFSKSMLDIAYGIYARKNYKEVSNNYNF